MLHRQHTEWTTGRALSRKARTCKLLLPTTWASCRTGVAHRAARVAHEHRKVHPDEISVLHPYPRNGSPGGSIATL